MRIVCRALFICLLLLDARAHALSCYTCTDPCGCQSCSTCGCAQCCTCEACDVTDCTTCGYCGNGSLEAGEQCDPPGDCCDTNCHFKSSSAVCRAAVTAADGTTCDVAEKCTGSSRTCPSDGLKAANTVCRAAVTGSDGDSCDSPETCSGSSSACPADGFKTAGTVCRAAVNSCDLDESCAGGTAVCPGDQFVADGVTCPDDGNLCTDDHCVAHQCAHPARPNGVACNADSNPCTPNDSCQHGVCQPDAPKRCAAPPCQQGSCDPASGDCVFVIVDAGNDDGGADGGNGACSAPCVVGGHCSPDGTCAGSTAPDGTPCDSACPSGGAWCMSGACTCMPRPPDLAVAPLPDLAGADFAGATAPPDLAVPRAPPDLSAGRPDLSATTTVGKGKSGCSCEVGGSRGPSGWWLGLLLLLALARRSRLRE